jgi:hypothetical protein
LDREASGDRKLSASSPLAATTDCRYTETSTESAVTCDMPTPEVIAF